MMGLFEEYRALYEKYIVDKTKVVILRYDPIKYRYEYKPYSHTVSDDAIDKLAELIINNMVFYAFSEDEIVEQSKKFGLLDDLLAAARYAYEQRLPKRENADTDGTVGEVLLDILIQVFEPVSQKLIARAKYKQQGDNSEIKGYDALYFTKSDEEISLWLGQVKTGTCSYCKSGIVDDLNNKYVLNYFCDAVFYIADKAEKANKLRELLDEANKICFESKRLNYDDQTKKGSLIQLLKNRNIKLKIPCLLAYTENIYADSRNLNCKIDECVKSMVDLFDKTDFDIIKDLEYEIFFLIFPVSDVKELREKIVKFKKQGC